MTARPSREEIKLQSRLFEPTLFDVSPEQPDGVLSTREGDIVRVINNEIYLLRKGEDVPRDIGFVNKHGINIRRKNPEHIVRMYNAYGVAFDVIKELRHFVWLVVHEEKGGKITSWQLPIAKVELCRVDQIGGFELQYFIPLEMLVEEL